MCYDRTWFVSQDRQAKAEKAKAEDKRSETVDALLRDSKEQAQKAAAEREPVKEKTPAD